MLDRLLAILLRLVLTGMIAGLAAVAVIAGYSGFIHLIRAQAQQAGWMLGLALVCGATAWVLITRRGDLADC